MRVQGSWVYICHSTAWSWRHKIIEKLKSFQEDIVLSDRSELDEKYYHKSHKGKKLPAVELKKRGYAGKEKRGKQRTCMLSHWRI